MEETNNLETLRSKLDNGGIQVPDSATFAQKYGNEEGFKSLYSKLDQGGIQVPDYEQFKTKYLSTQPKQDSYNPDENTGDPITQLLTTGAKFLTDLFKPASENAVAQATKDVSEIGKAPEITPQTPQQTIQKSDEFVNLLKDAFKQNLNNNYTKNSTQSFDFTPNTDVQHQYDQLATEQTQDVLSKLGFDLKPVDEKGIQQAYQFDKSLLQLSSKEIDDLKKDLFNIKQGEIERANKKIEQDVAGYGLVGITDRLPVYLKEKAIKNEINDKYDKLQLALSNIQNDVDNKYNLKPTHEGTEKATDINQSLDIVQKNIEDKNTQLNNLKSNQSGAFQDFALIGNNLQYATNPVLKDARQSALQTDFDFKNSLGENPEAVQGFEETGGLTPYETQKSVAIGIANTMQNTDAETNQLQKELDSSKEKLSTYIDNIKKQNRPYQDEEQKVIQTTSKYNQLLQKSININNNYNSELSTLMTTKAPLYKEGVVEEKRQQELSDNFPFLHAVTYGTKDFLNSVSKIPSYISIATGFTPEIDIQKEIGTNVSDIRPLVKSAGTDEKLALDKAQALQLFNNKGELSFDISWRPLVYSNVKTALEMTPFMLGQFAAAPIETALSAGIESQLGEIGAVNTIEDLTLGNIAKSNLQSLGVKTFGNIGKYGLTQAVNIIPSTLYFGNSMFKNYIEQGFQPEEATKLSLLSSAIEGYTEGFFGNEMAFAKSLIQRGEIKTAIELADNEIYKSAVTNFLEKSWTQKQANLLYNYIWKPSKNAVEQMLEEGHEEFLGNVLNKYLLEPLAQKSKSDYQEQDVNIENTLNTYLTTAATMLVMGAGSFRSGIHESQNDLSNSKFIVGNTPKKYISTTLDLVKKGIITSEEGQRRIGLINNYSAISSNTNSIASKRTEYSDKEKENLSFQIFDKLTRKADLSSELKGTLSEKQQASIIEAIAKNEESIEHLLTNGLYSSEEDRVKSKSKYLDSFFSPTSVKNYVTPSSIDSIVKDLSNQASKEVNQPLKTKLNEKIALLNQRKDEINNIKKEADKPLDQKAQENNQKSSITFTRTNGKPFQLNFNVPYHLSKIEELSTEGNKIFKRPLITVLQDNGDGSLTVSIDGETQSIPITDLQKYDFTEKSKVDELRKKGDISALFFDHENDVFNYTFSQETKDRDKEPIGRLKKENGNYYFVYKDKKGNIKKQLIKKEDFKAQRGFQKPKLRFNKTLLTPEEANQREEQYNKSVANTKLTQLDSQNARREAILQEFIKQETEKLTKLQDKTLSKLTKKLEKLSESMAKIKAIAKITNKNLSVKDLKTNLPKDLFQLIKSSGIAITPYDVLVALTEQHKFLQAQVIEIETEVNSLQQQRDAISQQVGEDWQELLDNDYESDRSLTEQIKEYRDSLKQQVQDNTTLLDKLKEFIDFAKDKLASIGNWYIELSASLESFNPLSTEEEQDTTNEDIKQKLDEAEKQYNEILSKNKELDTEYKKVDKLYKFIKSKEEEFKENKKKADLKKHKEEIFKTQNTSQSNSQTNSTEEDKVKADEEEAKSSKFDIGDIFNTTTSRADVDENGNIQSPNVLSLNNFLNRVKDIGKYTLLVLTKDNAKKFGLENAIYTDKEVTNAPLLDENGNVIPGSEDFQSNNDIILVVIKKGTEANPVFIDEFEEEIPKEALTHQNIVKATIRKASLTWKNGQVNHTIKGKVENTEEFTKAVEDAHAEFRQELINASKTQDITLDFTGITRGIKNEPLTTKEAQPASNLIPEGTNLSKEQVIQIPTVEKPSVIYQAMGRLVNMPIGRPILAIKQVFAFLNNRKFTSEESSKITALFQYLYDDIKNQDNSKKLDEDVLKYLSKIIYYRIPTRTSGTTGKQQDTPIGRSQVWFSYDADKLYLNLGKDFKVPFELEPNDYNTRTAIEAFFNGTLFPDNNQAAFHNVDATDLMKPFSEIVSIKGDKLQKRQWNTYQEYLISDKYPDGSSRPIEEIPLTVNQKPSTPTAPNTIQRSIVYSNPLNDDVLSKQGYSIVPNSTNTQVVNAPNTTPKVGFTTSKEQDLSKLSPYSKEKKQYRLEIISETGAVDTIDFTIGENKNSLVTDNTLSKGTEGNKEIKVFLDKILQGKDTISDTYVLKEVEVKESPTIKKEGFQETKITTIQETPLQQTTVEEFEMTSQEEMEKVFGLTKEQQKELDAIDEALRNKPKADIERRGQLLKDFIKASDGNNTSDTEALKLREELTKIGIVFKDGIRGAKEELAKYDAELVALDKPTTNKPKKKNDYRIAKQLRYKFENLKEAKKWFENRFPQLEFKTILGLVDGVAWGHVKDKMVILSNLAEEGTIYHEAFEAVYKYFLSPRQIERLNSQFRNRKGSFTDRETDKEVAYSNATDFQIKEQIAEEYRDFVLSNGLKKWNGEYIKNSLFRRLLNFIKDVLYNTDSIEEIFQKINEAKYKDQIPALNLIHTNDYRVEKIKEEDPAFFNDIMQAMTSIMFQGLQQANKPILSIFDKNSGFSLNTEYEIIKQKIDEYYGGENALKLLSILKTPQQFISYFSNPKNLPTLEAITSELPLDELPQMSLPLLLTKVYNVLQGYQKINESWNEFRLEHQDYLSKYGIEMLEEESEEVEDDERTGEYTPDQLTLSRKFNAKTEIKLLIATLREMDNIWVVDNEKLKRGHFEPRRKLNSILTANLVDYGSTITALLYKMTPATTFDEMMDIIKKESDISPSLAPLIQKLQPKIETPYSMDLKSKFFQSLMNMRVDFDKLIINTDLSGSSTNLNEQRAISLTKEKWLNSFLSNTNLIKSEESGKTLKKENLKTKQVSNEKEALSFLNEIGFNFTPDITKFSREERTTFLESTRDLFRVLTTKSPDLIFTDNALTRKQLNSLAEIYNKYTNSYSEPQHFNILGKPVQNILQENFVGKVIKVFNSVNTLQELYEKIPQLNPENEGNAFLKNSVINGVGRFFDAQGNKTQDISINIIDGSEVRDGNGIETSKLNQIDRIAQEFSYNLKGIYYLLTPADTKTEWALNLGTFLTESQSLDEETVLNTFKEYLKAEIATIQEGNPNNLAQLDKDDNKNQLRFFRNILKDVPLFITKDKTPEEIIQNREKDIDNAILKYLKQDVEDTYNYFDETGIITDYKAPEVDEENTSGFQETQGFKATSSFEEESTGIKPKSTTNLAIAFAPASFNEGGKTVQQIKDIIRFANINYQIAMMEQHKILWGDPAQWGDATKRVKSYVSGRNISVTGEFFDTYHNKVSNTRKFIDKNGKVQTIEFQDGDIGYNNYNGKIRTQTVKDVSVVSAYFEEIKEALKDNPESSNYEKMEESDGQGLTFALGEREIRQRDNTWTDADEEQFNWDDANFRKDNDFYPEGERGDLLREFDKQLIDRGNPYLNRAKNNEELPIQNVKKPIYSGLKDLNSLVQDVDKFSLAPITWNLAKQFTGLKELYIEHYKKQTHYIKFKSANKVGVQNDIQDFINKDGNINPTVEQEQLDFKYFGIQVETKEQKNASSLGTQTTKQATLDLMNDGVPIGYEGTKEEWESLSEQEKEQTSGNYRLVNENNRILKYMKEMATNTLFDEFGITKTTKNGVDYYQLTNLPKLEELIQREFKSRQLPDNLTQFAQLNARQDAFLIPFDLLIGGEKVENILNSIIDKRILRPKMYGGQLPQIAVTLFNKGKRDLVYKKDGVWTKVENLEDLSEEEKASTRITSSDLKFYRNKEGERVCEVYMPFYMKEFISQGKVLDINDIPEELRYGVGFRIPTQGINSIEHFKIKGFLPVEYGNSIVLPSEITTKAGSDFDIDKLNVYLYNYYVKNNKPVKVEFDNRDTPEATKERYDRKYRKVENFLKWFESNNGYDAFKNSKSWSDFTSSNNFLEFTQTIPESELSDIINSISDEESLRYTDFTKSYKDNIESLKLSVQLEESSTPTLNEFSKLPIYLQNSKKALDNKYIDNLRDILQLPENYKALVEPNSAKVLQDLAKKVNNLYQKSAKDAKTATDYLNRLNNAFTRHAFLVGKDAVGIGASHMSFHGIAQAVDLNFTKPVEITGVKQDKLFNFKSNAKIVGDSWIYSFAHILDAEGRKISSTISAFLNAFVDIAKDPFILDINGNYTTASIYLTGVKMGIPIETLAMWFTQPVIIDYIAESNKNKSILVKAQDKVLWKSQILENLGTKYGFDYKESISRPHEYSNKELEGYITEFVKVKNGDLNKYTQKFSENQGQLLKEFVQLESIAWELFNLQQGTNYDTKRTPTNDMIRIAFAKTNKARNTIFSPFVSKILNNTFLGVPFRTKFNFLESQKDLYLTESNIARDVLNPILIQLYQAQGLKADVIEKEARNLKRAFITYLIHTIPVSINQQPSQLLTSLITSLLKGDENISKRLLKVQEAEQSNKIDNNFFTSNLQALLPKLFKSKTANIRLLKKVNDKLDSDMMTSDWKNLKNQSLTSQFAYDLVSSALLQSGVRVTPTSMQELIPNQLFTEITNQVFDYFHSNPTQARQLIQNFQNSYYENNWQNRDLIPKARTKTTAGKSRLNNDFLTTKARKNQGIDKNITFLRYFVESDSFGVKITKEASKKYIFYSELKREEDGSPMFSPREREELAKKGQFDVFLDRVLFKRLEVFNKETGQFDSPVATDKYGNKYVLFYPVNKKGDGDNAVEHYSTPQKSQIWDKNFPAYTGEQITEALKNSNSLTGTFFHQTYKSLVNQKTLLDLSTFNDEEDMQEPSPTNVSDLVDNIISKKQEVIEQPIQNKEGISFVFEQSPELAKIGSKEQYSSYISTIFPESKVNEIVQHISKFKDRFETFDKSKSTEGVIFFSNLKSHYKDIIKDGHQILAVLNFKTPLQNANDINQAGDLQKVVSKLQVEGYDSAIAPLDNEFIAFEPEQIHILGNKQDIEGFKKFVEQPINKEIKPNELKKITTAEISDLIKQGEIVYLDENKKPCKNWTK